MLVSMRTSLAPQKSCLLSGKDGKQRSLAIRGLLPYPVRVSFSQAHKGTIHDPQTADEARVHASV
jgi:hypothetical protein